MEAFIQHNVFNRTVAIKCGERNNGMMSIYNFKTNEFKCLTEGSLLIEDEGHFITIPEDVYNAVVDAIQRDSMAPKPEKEYVSGKLEATEKHLEDMRKLALRGVEQ